MSKLIQTTIFIVLAALALITGCSNPSKPVDVIPNPVDTTSTVFTSPVTSIISGPSNNQIVISPSVTFEWKGNKDVSAFSYQFGGGSWSVWSSGTSATFDYLDEGEYSFAIRSIHRNGTTIESNYPTIKFVVDAVKGPSVMFTPRQKIVNVGDRFDYAIKAEEVTNLFAAKITFTYDQTRLQVDSVQNGTFFDGNGGSELLFPTIDNVVGKVTIEAVMIGRKPNGVTGSGEIAKLKCTALKTGQIDLVFGKNETNYRDTLNVSMPIKELVNGRISIR